MQVTVLGGGLAGCEAAWQLAREGVSTRLVEMRPVRMTEAHQTDRLAELVCSNSFRNNSTDSAVGLLKQEMRGLGSLVMEAADAAAVPAGAALAVDREAFAAAITARVEAEGRIEIVREEATALPEGPVIVATGPLTSELLYRHLQELFGREHLYFYDAISPIVTSESIDESIVFRASRYGRGGDDYLNCPMDRAQYERFVDDVLAAEKVPAKNFEKFVYFEGCMPIEELAHRGRQTLAFGPMRPVGLTDPRNWAAPPRGGAAPARQPGRHPVQPRGLPDEDDLARATPRPSPDSGACRCPVRTAREPPPEHIHPLAVAPSADAPVRPAR